jgi:hypothetical protein
MATRNAAVSCRQKLGCTNNPRFTASGRTVIHPISTTAATARALVTRRLMISRGWATVKTKMAFPILQCREDGGVLRPLSIWNPHSVIVTCFVRRFLRTG